MFDEKEICLKCKNNLGEHCEKAEISEVTMESGIIVKCPFFKLKDKEGE